MRLFMIVAFLLTACAASAGSTETPQPSSPPATVAFEFEFDPDQWTGEVEWDIVEKCSLLGISDCANRVADLKAGECGVESTRQLLVSLASNASADHEALVDTILERGDCLDLSVESWQLTRR